MATVASIPARMKAASEPWREDSHFCQCGHCGQRVGFAVRRRDGDVFLFEGHGWVKNGYDVWEPTPYHLRQRRFAERELQRPDLTKRQRYQLREKLRLDNFGRRHSMLGDARRELFARYPVGMELKNDRATLLASDKGDFYRAILESQEALRWHPLPIVFKCPACLRLNRAALEDTPHRA